MRFRARRARIVVVCAAAFAAVAVAVYFLLDNQRAAGAVTLAVVVAPAGLLALRVASESRGPPRPISVGPAAAPAGSAHHSGRGPRPLRPPGPPGRPDVQRVAQGRRA